MILDMAADAANSQTDYASVTPFVHRERVESVSQPPSSPSMRSSMDREKLVERLNAAADDPMWADHAEVPKITLRKAAARITELETELAAAQHQVKGALVMYDALVVKLEAKEAELAAMKARGDRLAEALEKVAGERAVKFDGSEPTHNVEIARRRSRPRSGRRVMGHMLNDLVADIYAANCAAGWWDDGAGKYVIATKVALIHSEVSEMLEGFRKGLPDTHLPHRSNAEVELADAIIRLLDLAGSQGFDVEAVIAERRGERAYNATRLDHSKAHRENGGKAF